jgi:glycosyltransferase involved in cell wall biosynthesis
MKKVYFNIRDNSRERMWDTVSQAPQVCEVLVPKVEQQSSIKTYAKSKASFISTLKYELSKKIINKQSVDREKSKEADLIYMWGAIPKNNKKEYIVELDNPYSLAYYHTNNFNKQKNKLTHYLEKAYKITCLSEACKNHTLELFGKQFQDKIFVSYPHMGANYQKNKREDGIINFIFVGLNSRGKGGAELLEAFHNNRTENIRLTFISNVDDDVKLKYQEDKRITILPPQPREHLLNKIYPKMDVMLFPSLYESFGVVLLEALSYGLAIITVNVYATPEIVKSGYNGKLLHHPILMPVNLNGEKVINCVDLRIKGFHQRYLENNEFYFGLYLELREAISEAEGSYKEWQKNSRILFDEKFSPRVWAENFKQIIES